MQVEIQYVEFKNLMSFGNSVTRVVLNEHKHTLMTGGNGQGKSSTIEAIFYGLYGKPYRNVKLGQLVNSINKKQLFVEIGIKSNNKQYIIQRGQKPNIFQIFEDGVLVQEDAASRDYQQFLETKIIGINQRSFRQIVCIGSASYKPFMDLTAAERRAITEEVLDISVFSSMSTLAKQYVAELKSDIDTLNTEISMLGSQKSMNDGMLKRLVDEKSVRDAEQANNKREVVELLESVQIKIEDLRVKLTDVDCESIDAKLVKVDSAIRQADSKISNAEYSIEQDTEALEKLKTAIHCPSCNQPLPEAMLAEQTLKLTARIETAQKMLDGYSTIMVGLKQKRESLDADNKVATQLSRDLAVALTERRDLDRQLKSFEVVDTSDSIDACKTTAISLEKQIDEKQTLKNDKTVVYNHYKTAIDLLKDDGIKSRIIATFIPLMNQYINEYLQKFDMFVKFELDEFFNEHILSRGRDSFSYNSFSQGEKQKIDIAILMAWRKVAMMRSSTACNLLIFDETMDSSLDNESIDIFIDVLGGVESNVNSLVISHRTTVTPEIFDRHVIISKVKDFSTIKEQ